jgi:hypothetical protein
MDLFSNTESVSVVPSPDRPQLTKAQKAFNTLISKIGQQRALLTEWEAAVPRYQQHHHAKMTPLLEEASRLRREFVLGLERAYAFKTLSKADRRLIGELICEVAGDLATENGDVEMKSIYNRYSGSDFDQEAAMGLSGMKEMLEDDLGVDLGDDLDLSDPEAFLAGMRARLEQEMEKEAAREAARPQRGKTAKQKAREAKMLEEEQRMGQSLREIYRKLASALHPDREPDPAEQARKTGLMQQVNQAYEKKDLLTLLELQLRIEHIDQAALNSFSEERLGHFNKILKEQLRELEERVAQIAGEIKADLGLVPFMHLSPAGLQRELDAGIAETRANLNALEADLKAIREVQSLKAWLKRLKRGRRVRLDDDFDDIPF